MGISATSLGISLIAIGWTIGHDVRSRRREKQRDQQAKTAAEQGRKEVAAHQEVQRRRNILNALRAEWIASNDGISAQMLAGTAPLPRDWVEQRLAAMGETWRQNAYY